MNFTISNSATNGDNLAAHKVKWGKKKVSVRDGKKKNKVSQFSAIHVPFSQVTPSKEIEQVSDNKEREGCQQFKRQWSLKESDLRRDWRGERLFFFFQPLFLLPFTLYLPLEG